MRSFIFTFVLCIINTVIYGQIGEIRTQETQYDYLRKFNHEITLLYDKTNETYTMVINSDNQFEEKTVDLNIGKLDEAITSVWDLYKAITVKGGNQTFEVMTYNVLTSEVPLIVEPDTNYVAFFSVVNGAGSFKLTHYTLTDLVEYLLDRDAVNFKPNEYELFIDRYDGKMKFYYHFTYKGMSFKNRGFVKYGKDYLQKMKKIPVGKRLSTNEISTLNSITSNLGLEKIMKLILQ